MPNEAIERAAIAMEKKHGLDFNEVCGADADPDEGYCDSGTCVAAFYEDHDADMARNEYRSQAKAAISAFLADVPVSEGMERDGGQEYAMTMQRPLIAEVNARAIFKATSAKLAKEIQ